MKRRTFIISASLGIALSTAGCAGDSTSSDPTETETSTSTPTTSAPEDTTSSSSTTEEQTETSTTTSSTAPSSVVDVTARDADRAEDGTLSVQWRPVTFEAFQWEGSDGQFYSDRDGERYLIVQLRLAASGRPLDVDVRRLEAVVDGEALGTQVFTGDLAVEEAVEPGAPVSGWRAWSIADDVDEVALRHAASSREYTTAFERDDALELDVESYDQ